MKKDSVMKKLFKYIGKYWILLILSIILAGISVVLQLYVPVLFGNAIDEIVAAHNVDFTQMWLYLKQILLFVVIAAAAIWIMNLVNNRMTYHIVQDIRSQAIRHIQKLPLSYLDQHSTGDIVSRIIADTDILSDGLLLGFTQLFSGVVTVVVTLIFMFSKNFWITLLVICLTPVSFWVAKFISSHSYGMFRKQSEARGKQTALIDEIVGNQKVVRAYGYEERASRRFAEINGELRDYSAQAVFYSSLTNPCTRFVNSLIYAGVALLGAILIPVGSLTVGGLTVLLSYANQYMKPFNDISSVVTEMQNALACAARLFALLEEPEESEDAAGTLEAPRGNVGIEDVSFSYDPNRKLIEHFNLDVKPGMRIAIVGPTGCGKTAAALALAEALGGEVINADSRQVYSDFPLITAQPSPEEQACCPHHLYGFLPTEQKISAGRWADQAVAEAKAVLARGHVPLLVGGTGLYFQGLLHGIAEIPAIDPAITAALTARLAEEGPAALHAELAAKDPAYAARIHPNDRQRIVRALEVLAGTGHTFSWWHEHGMPEPPCAGPLLVLDMELDALTPRLARRIDLMLEQGALDEARAARRRCDDAAAPGWSGIGCAEVLAHLRGELSLEECCRLWLHNTRAYAKRQRTWFRARSEARFFAPQDLDGLLAAARQAC